MKALTIHSRLEGFQLLESISEITPTAICGTACFDRAPMFIFLEVMAQLAALHVRHLVDFKRHAFLLKVARCTMPEGENLEGHLHMQAELLNQSSNAFAYKVKACGPDGEGTPAELLIGTQAYDDQFKEEYLQMYYKNRFNMLLG